MIDVRASEKVALTVLEAASVANVGRDLIYAEIASGALPARQIGRKMIVLRDDLEEWLHRLPKVVR